MVFGEARVAAQFPQDFAEGRIADGIGNELHVLAVAAEDAVHQFEGALVDADACDGHPDFGAFGDGAFDDFLVLEHDAAFDALEVGETAVRI